jgi:hypothetical protein
MTRRSLRPLLLTLAACAVASSPAWAKRDEDYVAPIYPARLLYSLIGVVPLAAVLIAVCALVMRWLSPRPSPPFRRFLKIAACLVIAGCLFAALDDLNDELWQPWFAASFFIAFIPAVALFLGSESGQMSNFLPLPLPLAAFLTVVTWFTLVFAGTTWQVWGFERGLPVCW